MARPRIRSDEQILEATRTVLMKQGPAAPLSAISKRLGTSPAALIGRFGSRRALVQAALVPPSPDALLAALYAAPSPTTFETQLTRLIADLCAWHRRAVPLRLLLRLTPPAKRPSSTVPAPQVRIHHALAIWLARAQAMGLVVPGDSHTLASTLLCMAQGWAVDNSLLAEARHPPVERLATRTASLLLRPSSR